jgi:hypothetical protein
MNRKVMEFMKEHRVNPVRRLPACAPADAGVLRIFPDDPQRHRIARRGVLLGV